LRKKRYGVLVIFIAIGLMFPMNILGEIFEPTDPSNWIHYDNGVFFGGGFNQGAHDLVWLMGAIRITPLELSGYDEWEITTVCIYVGHVNPSSMLGEAIVWGKGTAIEPGDIITTEAVTLTSIGWANITLSSPVTVDETEDYWVGFNITYDDSDGFGPFGVDDGTAYVQDRSFVNWSENEWAELEERGMPYNLMIRAGLELEYGDNTTFPNHKMHFPQYPDPYGWDVDWAAEETNYFLADDWMCNQTGPVTDIHFWVSSYEDYLSEEEIFSFINSSLILIADNAEDVYSYPNDILWQLFNFTLTVSGPFYGDEGWYIPWTEEAYYNNHDLFWRIDITNISDPFIQMNGTIYWLVIQVPAFGYLIGWKTSQDHFMDAAVYGFPGEWYPIHEPITYLPIDFAFVITGEYYEEPPEIENPKMTNPQHPDPFGWDVDFYNLLLGDDWQCNETGYVSDVHFWVSWIWDEVHWENISWINVSIWSDNATGNYSHPETMLWNETVTEFNISGPWYGMEGFYSPDIEQYEEYNHEEYYQIDIENITDPFIQENGTIYWFVLNMPYSPEEYWLMGWKTTTDNWNDAAVWGYDEGMGPFYQEWNNLSDPLTNESLDFAFVITGEPYEYPWDVNHDNVVNYLDISALISRYGESGAPGWIPEDINDDGVVDYLDISILISHYGESY